MSPRAMPPTAHTGIRPQFVKLESRGGVLRARFVGPVVGQREAPIISDEVSKAVDTAGKRLRFLVLDLSDVRALASMGLGTCIQVRNRAREYGATTVMFGVNDELRALIKMVKVDRLFKFAEKEDELARLVG